MSKLTDADKALIRDIQGKLRVTKLVCTRAIKGKNGDFFVGMSAAWSTTQEDGGGMGADLISAMDEGEDKVAAGLSGMSLKETKIAGYILAMQTDLQAQDHALAGGGITVDQHATAQRAVRSNYTKLLTAAMQPTPAPKVEEKG